MKVGTHLCPGFLGTYIPCSPLVRPQSFGSASDGHRAVFSTPTELSLPPFPVNALPSGHPHSWEGGPPSTCFNMLFPTVGSVLGVA